MSVRVIKSMTMPGFAVVLLRIHLGIVKTLNHSCAGLQKVVTLT